MMSTKDRTPYVNLVSKDPSLRQVPDLMTQEVVSIQADSSIQKAIESMKMRHVKFLPICNGNRVIGVLTEKDIQNRVTDRKLDPEKTLAFDAMTRKIIFCDDDDDLFGALCLMNKHRVRRLLVYSEYGNLRGVISRSDIIRDFEAYPWAIDNHMPTPRDQGHFRLASNAS